MQATVAGGVAALNHRLLLLLLMPSASSLSREVFDPKPTSKNSALLSTFLFYRTVSGATAHKLRANGPTTL